MLCKNNLVRYSPLHRLGSKSYVLNTTQTGFLLEEKLGAETMGHVFKQYAIVSIVLSLVLEV